MTNKLKTLKDLTHQVIDQAGNEEVKRFGLVEDVELRKEAIKWVKEGSKSSLTAWRYMYMKFFNITEEELAGGQDE